MRRTKSWNKPKSWKMSSTSATRGGKAAGLERGWFGGVPHETNEIMEQTELMGVTK